jgi:hypothetical protein
MKKMKVLTRNFINDNIKVNTTVDSYPQRTVTPEASKPKPEKSLTKTDNAIKNSTPLKSS